MRLLYIEMICKEDICQFGAESRGIKFFWKRQIPEQIKRGSLRALQGLAALHQDFQASLTLWPSYWRDEFKSDRVRV